VTAADTQAELNLPFPAPRSADDGIMRHCVYNSSSARVCIYIDSQTVDEQQLHSPIFARIWNPGPSGLGAPAYINGQTRQLAFWKKGVLTSIRVGDQSGTTTREQQEVRQEALARRAIPRA
jgi:hypothetical protein